VNGPETGSPRVEPAGFWTSVRQVLTSPTLGFFRLAENGEWLAPLVLATFIGLTGGGMEALKTLLLIALGDFSLSAAYLGKLFGLLVLLAPLYYAAMVAVFALVGTVVAGGQAGISFRKAFQRCWAVLGWVNLPLVLLTLVMLVLFFTVLREEVGPYLAAVPSGTLPTYSYSPPLIVGLGLAAWLVALLVMAVRQAFATTTGRAIVTIIIVGLLFGALVHTPMQRHVAHTVLDTHETLGRGRAYASVNLLAYRLPWSQGPERGHLVAVAPTDGPSPPDFILRAVGMDVVRIQGRRPRAYLVRVAGLPGDRVEIGSGSATVPDGFVFVVPDDPTLVEGLPEGCGPLVSLDRVMGQVFAVGFLGSPDGGG
jgi:hypothetical protein